MQQLQDELELEYPNLSLQILGVNEAGFESGNDLMCDGRDLPWLQDVAEVDVWQTLWEVTYRDVVILDAENVIFGVYNVTEHNLSLPDEYAGFRAMLLAAAEIVE